MSSDEHSRKAAEKVELGGVTFTHTEIATVVEDFYNRVQADPLLQAPFRSVEDWPLHIRRLTHFWWIRFGGRPYLFYQYDPVTKHFFAGFNGELLERWLDLFNQTLKDHLSETQSELWRTVTVRMGHSLTMKNEMYRQAYENKNSL